MKIKHFTAAVFSLIIAALLFSVTSFAEDDELSYDIFTYTVKNQQVTIKSIDATGLKKVYIPETIDGKTVAAIDYWVSIKSNAPFELYIPSTVYDLFDPKSPDSTVEKYARVSKFIVDEENEDYSSDKYGVIYDKNKESLLMFPSSSTVNDYVAPSSLKTIVGMAFKFCKSIQTVTLNDGIKNIERFAFYGATNLESINFPDGLECIGEDAFIQCYNLKEAVLPDSVTEICGSAFSECKSLREFVFPEKITKLDVFVLADDINLERVVIPAGVTTVWNNAFYNCPKLRHIYFKGTEEQWNSIPNIDEKDGISDAVIHFNYEPSDAFDEVDISIANGIMYVSGKAEIKNTKQNNVFFFEEQCDDVTTIILSGISRVGEYAFDNYPSLVNVIVLDADPVFAENAFSDCPQLETVLFSGGSEVTSFAEDDELSYDIFTYTVKNQQVTINSIDATGLKKVYIPETIDGKTVAAIDYWVSIKSNAPFELYIPSTVYDLFDPKSPDSTVEKYARVSKFIVDEENENYSSDKYGVIYDKNKESLLMFPRSSTVNDYVAPSSLKTIVGMAFKFCKSIQTVTLNDGIKNIERFAFYGATNLESINFPDGLECIGEDAFIQCYNLKEAVLPDSVTEICGSAFSECKSLREFVFPDKITKLDFFVLADDINLERVVIPAEVTSVWGNALYDCPKLKHIYFKGTEEQWNSIPNIDEKDGISDAVIHFNYEPSDAFDEVDISIANGIMYVSGKAEIKNTKQNNVFFFEEQCDDVTTIILSGISRVGEYAFDNYPSLVNVIVLDADPVFAENAFSDCPQLETVLFSGGSEFTDSSFDGCSENVRIFVNDGSSHPAGEKIIPYIFSNGVLEFGGSIRLNRYEFFDTIAAFCLEFNNIEKLKFEKLAFEDIGLYYYPDDESEPVLIEGNSLEEGEITVYITENGENRNISFNELIEGIEDESITEFLLSATDKNHAQTKDTVFSIIKKAVLRALKWVVSLMNKVFNLIGKK